ncbi:MAG: hypothetical protein AAB409_09720 [Gemmatimonadota bacterium]
MLAYRRETAIAEKFHAMVVLGRVNTRLRDFLVSGHSAGVPDIGIPQQSRAYAAVGGADAACWVRPGAGADGRRGRSRGVPASAR